MKIYKVKFTTDGTRVRNKIVIAQNIEQMRTLIEDKYMIPRCFIDFINIEEIEIKESVIDICI
jgi:hypothetical protein